ncbi:MULTISPECIES: PKD domain-containing protein [Flavobacterium]|uniref:PKD domain-containing protein n=2 Tax=Flavobacterium TaxID=237 RepID=A0AA94JMW3_9FLAO|nr:MULTISPECIES: PKD domain-containing protein [Flavobacterium]OXA82299.1 PKD domain protein [Flavobacterium columnare] [Flavobacterium columnare NBRC 100251 = ATCC 23463]AMA50390.1 PKD domain protein [Flavobacterium covae]AND64069.1 PKD domain protein [Flavobacterium covae]MCH4829591.1 PKD domain-containing protein [Flavobacterium columnare]MCH4831412.1 PKD domain-containing protein [Flavobacterium columnare]
MKRFFNKFNYLTKIDVRIFLGFGLLILLGFGIFLFKYSRHIDCNTGNFLITADEFKPDEVVEFFDNTKGASSWEWDFGDSTTVDNRQRTFHKYKKEGDYVVKLIVNGSCYYEKLVRITNVGQQTGYLPLIKAPNVAFLGEVVRFSAEKNGGESWEWSFGETTSLDAVGQNVSYKFKTTGEKKITLIVNGDLEHIATKIIYVAPKVIVAKQKIDMETYEYEKPHSTFSLPRGMAKKDPLEDMLGYIPVSPKHDNHKESNEKTKTSEISNEQFQLLLKQVAAQVKTKDDFKEYLCGNFEIPVVVNDDNVMSFSELCKSISGKQIKITFLQLNRNDNSNCIQNINIQYKTKKWMIWVKE